MAFDLFGIRGSSTLRTPRPDASNNYDLALIPDLEADIKLRNGGLNPSRKSDLVEIEAFLKKKQSGQMTPEEERALVTLNPALKGLMQAVPVSSEAAVGKLRQEIGSKYFHPGQEAVPFETTEEQEFGLPALKGNLAQEAVAPKADVQGAILEALRRGDIDYAKSLGMGKQPDKKGLYGGVQYAYNPKTKTYIPYSIDENTREAVPIKTPEGTVATVPVAAQPGVGPEGVGIYQFPTRAPGGAGPSAVEGITPMPTSEEAASASKFSVAQDMARRLKEGLERKRYSVGPVVGRGLRIKGATGINLTDDEADAISIEQQLGNLVLQAMRGAQVGPKEQEMFQKQLPRIDQPEPLFKKNIDNTLRNLAYMERLLKSQRPIKTEDQSIETPKTSSGWKIERVK